MQPPGNPSIPSPIIIPPPGARRRDGGRGQSTTQISSNPIEAPGISSTDFRGVKIPGPEIFKISEDEKIKLTFQQPLISPSPVSNGIIDETNSSRLQGDIVSDSTGSLDRPQFILVSDFHPLYLGSQDLTKTPFFDYFDTMIETRKMKSLLYFNEIKNRSVQNEEFRQGTKKIYSQNKRTIDFLIERYKSVFLIFKQIEKFIRLLNPRDALNQINCDIALRDLFLNSSSSWDSFVSKNLPSLNKVSANDLILLSGFLEQNFSNYSNTKVLIQSIESLFAQFRGHDIKIISPDPSRDITNNIVSYPEGDFINIRELTLGNDAISENDLFSILSFGLKTRAVYTSRPRDFGTSFISETSVSESNEINLHEDYLKTNQFLDFCLEKTKSISNFLFYNGGPIQIKNNDSFYKIISLLSQEVSISYFSNKNENLFVDRSISKTNIGNLKDFFFSGIDRTFSNNIYNPISSAVNNNKTLNFEINPISFNGQNYSSGFVKNFENGIFPKLNPGADPSFQFESANKFRSSIRNTLASLRLLKDVGYVPIDRGLEQQTSYSTALGFFKLTYLKFFDENGGKKFDENELSSLVVSSILNNQFDFPIRSSDLESERSSEVVRGTKFLKYFLFKFILGDVCSDPDFEKFFLELGFSIKKADNTESDLRDDLFKTLKNRTFDIFGSRYNESFSISENEFKETFKWTQKSSLNDINAPIPENSGKTLYTLISECFKDFFTVLYKNCLNELGKTQFRKMSLFSILLMYYEVILYILKGNFSQKISHYNSSSKKFEKSIAVYKSTISFEEFSSNIKIKDDNIVRNFSFLYGYFSNIVREIDALEALTKKKENIDFIKFTLPFLGEQQPDNVKKYFSKQQISLSYNVAKELEDLFKGSNFDNSGIPNVSFSNSSVIRDKSKRALYGIFKNDGLFRQKGARVLSVGIPAGLSNGIGRKAGSFTVKQKDFIKIKVYKIELTRPDVVFNPIEFVFELSRFPCRIDDFLFESENIQKQFGLFPTRDLDSNNISSNIQFGASFSGDIDLAFDGTDYDFLRPNDKKIIYNNHIISYLLETYIRIVSGISLTEESFLLKGQVNDLALQEEALVNVLGENLVLSDASGANSPLNSTVSIARNIVSPKKYDRIFNIPVHSSQFEVNLEDTDRWVSAKIISNLDPDFYGSGNKFFLKSDKINFESFFVQIETLEVGGGA
jgi:hypothetical protein